MKVVTQLNSILLDGLINSGNVDNQLLVAIYLIEKELMKR